MYSNLSSAELGGVPGTLNLVRSFLNIKHATPAPGLDDGLVEGVPVWPMIFYCLRCGDISAALDAATKAGPALQEAITLLRELSSSAGKLSQLSHKLSLSCPPLQMGGCPLLQRTRCACSTGGTAASLSTRTRGRCTASSGPPTSRTSTARSSPASMTISG